MLLYFSMNFQETFTFFFIGFSGKMEIYKIIKHCKSFNLGVDNLFENSSVCDDDIPVHLDGT